MGTAIEMWEAYQHGAAVVTISPMRHNWAVKFLSHAALRRSGGVRGRLAKRRSRSADRRGPETAKECRLPPTDC